MINNDRIVPVTKTDLLTLYYTMFKMLSEQRDDLHKLEAINAEGDFEVPKSGTGLYFCDEPVRKFIVPEGVTTFSVIFIPAYSFEGIDGVDPNGASLYQAAYTNGTWQVVNTENT